MKKTETTIGGLLLGAMLGVGLTANTKAQGLQFSGIAVTEESAIRLEWESETGAVYTVQYAAQLVDASVGDTAWQTLYQHYPSHGTNTFCLDAGDYYQEPPVLHPRRTEVRCYRVFNEGSDTAPAPTVVIGFPTNGATMSGTFVVTVTAETDQATLSAQLYVDGERMQPFDTRTNYLDTGTNYVTDTYIVNSCEWPNGTHTFFAVATCASDFGGPLDAPPIGVGHAVSPYVQVNFNNLITRYSFSEPFFDPGAGQTQQVSALFPANADWTLAIQDASSNTVRSTSGSGMSMRFSWDGTATGGSVVPVGFYIYLLTAQTNGQAFTASSMQGAAPALSDSGGASESAAPSSTWFPTSAAEAVEAGWSSFYMVPPPMPDVMVVTNGVRMWLPWEEIFGPETLTEVQVPARFQRSTAVGSGPPSGPLDAGFGGPASQATAGPNRAPNAPVAGTAGTFGVACQSYGPSGFSLAAPLSTPGLPSLHVSLENRPGSHPWSAGALPGEGYLAEAFIREMRSRNWKMGFNKQDGNLLASDLRSTGANVFNQVNLGLLIVHAAYGTSPDYYAFGVQQIYFPIHIPASNSGSWVRMSEMSLGSAGTDGLRWMAIMACNSLRSDNWYSMQSGMIWPFNSSLHLFLGGDSDLYPDDYNVSIWPREMLGLADGQVKPVLQAWYNAGRAGYGHGVPIRFAVAGYDGCKEDTLSSTGAPSGVIFYESIEVKSP